MKNTVDKIFQWLESGDDVGIICTLAISGSVPGKVGTMMAVTKDDTVGTIGGGALEAAAITEIRNMKIPTTVKKYDLEQDAGMICGGSSTLLMHTLNESDKRVFMSVHSLSALSKPCSLAILADRERFVMSCIGESCGACCEIDGENITVCIPIVPVGKVYIFGGGHISLALTKILDIMETPYVTIEDRVQYNTADRFPNSSQRIVCDYSRLPISLCAGDFCVILTRGHIGDLDVLSQVLSSKARYIGLIGSKNKMVSTGKKLSDLGFSSRDIDRIHSPIGIDLGGNTPAEIAVSIASELIMERSGRL